MFHTNHCSKCFLQNGSSKNAPEASMKAPRLLVGGRANSAGDTRPFVGPALPRLVLRRFRGRYLRHRSPSVSLHCVAIGGLRHGAAVPHNAIIRQPLGELLANRPESFTNHAKSLRSRPGSLTNHPESFTNDSESLTNHPE